MGLFLQFEVPRVKRCSFTPIEEHRNADCSIYKDLCAESKTVVFDNFVTYSGKKQPRLC